MLEDLSCAPESDLDRHILDLICIGLPDREIAAAVHASHQTVRNRVSSMLRRSNISNRTQLAWAYHSQILVARMLENLASQRQR